MLGTCVLIYLFIHIRIQGVTLKCKAGKGFTAVSVGEPINTNQIKISEGKMRLRGLVEEQVVVGA